MHDIFVDGPANDIRAEQVQPGISQDDQQRQYAVPPLFTN